MCCSGPSLCSRIFVLLVKKYLVVLAQKVNSNRTMSQHKNLIYQEWRVVQKLLWKKNYEVKWLFVTVINKICSFRRFWFLLKRISFAESAFSLNRMQSVLHFYSSQEKKLFNLDTWLVAFATFQIEIFYTWRNAQKYIFWLIFAKGKLSKKMLFSI